MNDHILNGFQFEMKDLLVGLKGLKQELENIKYHDLLLLKIFLNYKVSIDDNIEHILKQINVLRIDMNILIDLFQNAELKNNNHPTEPNSQYNHLESFTDDDDDDNYAPPRIWCVKDEVKKSSQNIDERLQVNLLMNGRFNTCDYVTKYKPDMNRYKKRSYNKLSVQENTTRLEFKPVCVTNNKINLANFTKFMAIPTSPTIRDLFYNDLYFRFNIKLPEQVEVKGNNNIREYNSNDKTLKKILFTSGVKTNTYCCPAIEKHSNELKLKKKSLFLNFGTGGYPASLLKFAPLATPENTTTPYLIKFPPNFAGSGTINGNKGHHIVKVQGRFNNNTKDIIISNNNNSRLPINDHKNSPKFHHSNAQRTNDRNIQSDSINNNNNKSNRHHHQRHQANTTKISETKSQEENREKSKSKRRTIKSTYQNKYFAQLKFFWGKKIII